MRLVWDLMRMERERGFLQRKNDVGPVLLDVETSTTERMCLG